MKQYFLLFMVIFTLGACHFSSQRRNEKSDIDDAERALNKFWFAKLNGHNDSLISFFSTRAFEKIPQSRFENLFKETSIRYGNLKSINLKNAQTLVVSEAESIGQYQLTYESNYEKGTIGEVFYLEKKGEKQIELLNYAVNIMP